MAEGHFITFEGGEGAGKSTQIRLLSEHLESSGIDVTLTREPGGSEGAEQIRNLLVQGDTNRWDGMTEALLNFAARRDHIEKTIKPALARGHWVLSDRYADSTMAYQGYGHGLGPDLVSRLWDVSIEGYKPALTLILDVPPQQGIKRTQDRTGSEDRYERMDVSFHERLREGFLEIARSDPGRCVVIDATRPISDIQEDIRTCIAERFLSRT